MSRAWSLLFSLPGIGCLPELTPPEPESVVAAEWRAEPRAEVGRPLPVSRSTLTGPEPQHVLPVRGTLSPQQQRAWADGVASDAVLSAMQSIPAPAVVPQPVPAPVIVEEHYHTYPRPAWWYHQRYHRGHWHPRHRGHRHGGFSWGISFSN